MNSSQTPGNYSRNESSGERLDRNWNELLQELRVMQTGVQLLTGFLLTVPFQSRFDELTDGQVALFLALVLGSSIATILLLSVVQLHRILFGQQVKDRVVAHSSQIVRFTVGLIGLLILGVCALIFDIVLGDLAALIATAALLVLMAWFWFVYPALVRRSEPRTDLGSTEHAEPRSPGSGSAGRSPRAG